MTQDEGEPAGPEGDEIAEALRQMAADRRDDANPAPGSTPGPPATPTPKSTAYVRQRFLRGDVWPREHHT